MHACVCACVCVCVYVHVRMRVCVYVIDYDVCDYGRKTYCLHGWEIIIVVNHFLVGGIRTALFQKWRQLVTLQM